MYYTNVNFTLLVFPNNCIYLQYWLLMLHEIYMINALKSFVGLHKFQWLTTSIISVLTHCIDLLSELWHCRPSSSAMSVTSTSWRSRLKGKPWRHSYSWRKTGRDWPGYTSPLHTHCSSVSLFSPTICMCICRWGCLYFLCVWCQYLFGSGSYRTAGGLGRSSERDFGGPPGDDYEDDESTGWGSAVYSRCCPTYQGGQLSLPSSSFGNKRRLTVEF